MLMRQCFAPTQRDSDPAVSAVLLPLSLAEQIAQLQKQVYSVAHFAHVAAFVFALPVHIFVVVFAAFFLALLNTCNKAFVFIGKAILRDTDRNCMRIRVHEARSGCALFAAVAMRRNRHPIRLLTLQTVC